MIRNAIGGKESHESTKGLETKGTRGIHTVRPASLRMGAEVRAERCGMGRVAVSIRERPAVAYDKGR